MKKLLFCLAFVCIVSHAAVDPLEGLWQGYDAEWSHVSRQLIALAEVIPADQYSWRPAPGVRSVSDVFMHVAIENFSLLSVNGPPMPADLREEMEKTITAKQEVIAWLKRSLDAVGSDHAHVDASELQRKVRINGRYATVDGMYVRILVHDNEHMGQLVALARMNGIALPWSETG